MAAPRATLTVDGHELSVSNPDKVFFPALGVTKMDLIEYYLSVADGAMVGVRDRPTIMKRYPNGAGEDFFFQKRLPDWAPEWIQTARVRFPSGREADFIAPADAAHIVWLVGLGCIDLNPWNVRIADVDRPDELRIDLDPTPGIPFDHVRRVAMVCRDVLAEHELVGWPSTSGSRGMHIVARIEPEHGFTTVRRAALAFGREVERRSLLATTAWWKEERVGVLVDYNMNARDRTVSSVYSVRPVPDARVATPLAWDEVPDVEPADLTIATVPARYREIGDPGAGIDDAVGTIDALLELAARDEADGRGDAPWPPHYPKGEDEPVRAPPSKRRWEGDDQGPRARGGGKRPADGHGGRRGTQRGRGSD